MPTSKGSTSTPSQPKPEMEIVVVFKKFTAQVRPLLVPRNDDGTLGHLLTFRDQVYKIVEDETFLAELSKAFDQIGSSQDIAVGSEKINALKVALVEEIKGVNLGLEVLQTTEPKEPAEEGWVKWRKLLLPKASIATGSLKEIAGEYSAYVKIGLTLLKELFDLFKGKG